MARQRYIQLYDNDKQIILGSDGVVNFDNRKNNETAVWELKRNIEMLQNSMRMHKELKSRNIYSTRPLLSNAVYYTVLKGDITIQELTKIF